MESLAEEMTNLKIEDKDAEKLKKQVESLKKFVETLENLKLNFLKCQQRFENLTTVSKPAFTNYVFPKELVVSNNNQTLTSCTEGFVRTIFSSQEWTSGKPYFEVQINSQGGKDNKMMIGFADVSKINNQTYLGYSDRGWGLFAFDGSLYHDSKSTPFTSPLKINDKIGMSLDFSTNSVFIYQNGQLVGEAFKGITGPVRAAVSLFNKHDKVTMIDAKEPKDAWKNCPDCGFSNEFKTAELLSDGYRTLFSSKVYKTGKHYFEVVVDKSQTQSKIEIGVAGYDDNKVQVSLSSKGWCLNASGSKSHNGQTTTYGGGFDGTSDTKRKVGVILDLDAKTIQIDSSDKTIGVAFNNVVGPVRAAVSLFHKGDKVTLNLDAVKPIPKPVVDRLFVLRMKPEYFKSEGNTHTKLGQNGWATGHIWASDPVLTGQKKFHKFKLISINNDKTGMVIGATHLLNDSLQYNQGPSINMSGKFVYGLNTNVGVVGNNGDVIGILIDRTTQNHAVWFFKNGVYTNNVAYLDSYVEKYYSVALLYYKNDTIEITK